MFDRIVDSFATDPQGAAYLEDCMSLDPDLNRRVPLRYRIIAKSFVTHSSLDEVNARLKDAGCATLYSRSIWEASLIYAFAKGKSYSEWKQLQQICALVREQQEQMGSDGAFAHGSIRLSDIRSYIMENSAADPDAGPAEEGSARDAAGTDSAQDADAGARAELVTQHLTRALDSSLQGLPDDLEEFRAFLIHNIETMSPVREKTRYYFCKYLYYYLIACRDRYLEARHSAAAKISAGGSPAGTTAHVGSSAAATEAGISAAADREALAEIAAFKGLTTLSRKRMSDKDVIAFLDDSGISLGEIFDAFNYFYFGYVSLDWMEVLLDYYGNIDSLPDEERAQLASSLRKYDARKYSGLSDQEVLSLKQSEMEQDELAQDERYRPGSEALNYQRDRAGENTIRKYIKGSLDIDRTTLICFLLFFNDGAGGSARSTTGAGASANRAGSTRGASANGGQSAGIDVSRLNSILEECGYAPLRSSDGFDYFVIKFIETDEPVDCLMETVTDYALDEENFFLYRMYRASRNADEDFRSIT